DLARDTFQRSLSLLQETGDRWQEGVLRLLIGIHAQIAGQLAEAEEHLFAALRLLRGAPDPAYEGHAPGHLGVIRLGQRCFVEARACFEEAVAIQREVGPIESAKAQADLSLLAHHEGRLVEARPSYLAVIALLRGLKMPYTEEYTHTCLGIL